MLAGAAEGVRIDVTDWLALDTAPLLAHDDDVFYLFLQILAETKNRSQAPYIPLGRYVP
jgi:hypothetical protein